MESMSHHLCNRQYSPADLNWGYIMKQWIIFELLWHHAIQSKILHCLYNYMYMYMHAVTITGSMQLYMYMYVHQCKYSSIGIYHIQTVCIILLGVLLFMIAQWWFFYCAICIYCSLFHRPYIWNGEIPMIVCMAYIYIYTCTCTCSYKWYLYSIFVWYNLIDCLLDWFVYLYVFSMWLLMRSWSIFHQLRCNAVRNVCVPSLPMCACMSVTLYT